MVLLGGDMDFKIMDGFVMDLDPGINLVLVNVNGLRERKEGGGGGISKQSDFRSSMSCLGLG